jgi:hypothetical protein
VAGYRQKKWNSFHSRNFSLCHHIQSSPGVYPVSYPISKCDLCFMVKQLKCENDNSKITAEEKNLTYFTEIP